MVKRMLPSIREVKNAASRPDEMPTAIRRRLLPSTRRRMAMRAGTKGHADADLLGTLDYKERDDAVKTYDGENESCQREEADEN